MGLGISAPARGGRRRGCSSEQLSKAANATKCYGDLYHGGRYTYGSEGEGKGEGGVRRCYLLLGTNSSSRRWQRRRLLLIVTGEETAELTTTGGSLAADWRVGGWVGEGATVADVVRAARALHNATFFPLWKKESDHGGPQRSDTSGRHGCFVVPVCYCALCMPIRPMEIVIASIVSAFIESLMTCFIGYGQLGPVRIGSGHS